MIKLGPIRIYFGGLIRAWRMVGIGWRETLFLGFSVNINLWKYSYDE